MHRLTSGVVLTLFLAVSPASASNLRSWVSGTGNDGNPCTRSSPCATFAVAYLNTSAGGEIDAVDPGEYGPLTISHSITIDGGGGVASITSTNTDCGFNTAICVLVLGASDMVILRNLSITVTPGPEGYGLIVANGAGTVHVESMSPLA